MYRYAPISALYEVWWSGWIMHVLDAPHGHYSFLAEWRCCCEGCNA